MDEKNRKTLRVFVYDVIKVSDRYKKKALRSLGTRPVLCEFEDFVLNELFVGGVSYARPPTVLNYLGLERDHSVL